MESVTTPFVVLAAFTLAAVVYYRWLWFHVCPPEVSGDGWYYRTYAFTDLAVSQPYCWRPLFPLLARYLGFEFVSLTASFLTPLVIYFYVGCGWIGTACGLSFIGAKSMFNFNVKNVDYSDALGQFLFISCLWAMSVHHWSAWLLGPLCMLCREALGGAVGLLALFTWPLLSIPVGAAGALAYFTRRADDPSNRHPLVEDTAYKTLVRWMRTKLDASTHYAHTIQPLRGSPLAVPFVWDHMPAFACWSLLAVVPIWIGSLAASGQSRHSCYWFGIFVPFIAAAGLEWAWLYCLACWFWPFDFSTYDETGGVTFGYAK